MKFLSLFFFPVFWTALFAADKPNVIIILADDLGTGDVKSFYAPSKVETPNIDQLVTEGMKFTQAYAPGSVCSPTRYGILTGMFPVRGPIRMAPAKYDSPLAIEVDSMSLPRFFKEQGYRTAGIGKWHLGYGENGITNWAGEIKPGPNDIGFDYHISLPTNHSDNFKSYVEGHRLLWLKEDITELSGKPELEQLTRYRYHDEVDSDLTAKAISFIEEHAEEPFFIYLALTAVHTHITPHVDFRGKSEIGQLGDYILELDHHVGSIMNTLEELKLADNTLLVFTSDNGGQKGDHRGAGKNLILRDESGEVAEKSKNAKNVARDEHGHKSNGDFRGFKGGNYEGGFRVPFVVRWPGRIPAGTTSEAMISLADFMATSAGFLGVELPPEAGGDSFDLSPDMRGEEVEAPIRTSVILQTGRNQLAYRSGDWKIVSTKKTVWEGDEARLPLTAFELYQLSEDPNETTDLADTHRRELRQLRRELLDQIKAGRTRD